MSTSISHLDADLHFVRDDSSVNRLLHICAHTFLYVAFRLCSVTTQGKSRSSSTTMQLMRSVISLLLHMCSLCVSSFSFLSTDVLSENARFLFRPQHVHPRGMLTLPRFRSEGMPSVDEPLENQRFIRGDTVLSEYRNCVLRYTSRIRGGSFKVLICSARPQTNAQVRPYARM